MPSTDFVLMPYTLWLNVIYWVYLFSATAKCRNIKDLIICDYKDSLINCCNWGIDQNQNSVQSFSCVQFLVTPWTAACHASISITNSRSLLRLMSFSSYLQSFPASGTFQVSVLRIRLPKYWSFSFSISPSKTKILILLKIVFGNSLAV